MVKNVKKEKYPQHHTQKVKNKTQPNHPSLPPSIPSTEHKTDTTLSYQVQN